MRRIVVMLAVLLLISACNLSNKDLTPTVPSNTISAPAITPPVDTLTPLPGVTEVVAPTLTPFTNNTLPTSQVIAPPGVISTTAPVGGESATIDSPISGATVSGSPLMVSGVAHNLTQNQFTLQVFDGGGDSITPPQPIPLSNPNHAADVPWTASTSLGTYTGPAQIRIIDGSTQIGMVNVTIVAPTAQSQTSNSSNPQPTAGTALGTISSPTNGATLSGTSITVNGTAGGFPGNQFTLLLLDSKETVLTSVVITLTNSAQNPVPWSGSLNTSGFKGYAEIRAVETQNGTSTTIASVIVKLQ